MHYYQFNIGDYSSHTKGLSPIEDLAYRRMIDEYYLSENPFTGTAADVARLIGLRDFVSEVEYVLERYFTKSDDKWAHGRIDSDITNYHSKQTKRSIAGKKSAEMRNFPSSDDQENNKRSTHVEQVFNTCSTDVQLTNNHKPITNNQEPIKEKAKACPFEKQSLEVFEHWKNVFKKTNQTAFKGVRETKIKARLKEGYSAEQIKTAIDNAAKSEFHTANNHTDIELICRNAVKLDGFISMVHEKPKNETLHDSGEPFDRSKFIAVKPKWAQ